MSASGLGSRATGLSDSPLTLGFSVPIFCLLLCRVWAWVSHHPPGACQRLASWCPRPAGSESSLRKISTCLCARNCEQALLFPLVLGSDSTLELCGRRGGLTNTDSWSLSQGLGCGLGESGVQPSQTPHVVTLRDSVLRGAGREPPSRRDLQVGSGMVVCTSLRGEWLCSAFKGLLLQ